MTIGPLPQLPLVCLETADFKNTDDVVRGKNTVIDFWTTKCTRCPDALDKLDSMAKQEKYANVQFVSICCDKLDGARDIIEKEDELRWTNVSHYFMDHKDKETAKKILGFKSVPFYVVLDENGEITQLGNDKVVNFETLPGVEIKEEEKYDNRFDACFDDKDDIPQIVREQEEKKNDDYDDFTTGMASLSIVQVPTAPPVQVDRVFNMDDFDF